MLDVGRHQILKFKSTMAIPDFQSLMLPLLKAASDGQSHSINNVCEKLATEFSLTEEELNQYLASGSQKIFYNRVYWAKAYLKMAGLVENVSRGFFKITLVGVDVLKQQPSEINIKFLRRFQSFIDSTTKRDEEKEINTSEVVEVNIDKTPEEIISNNYLKIRKALAFELLSKVKQCTPAFFETLVVDLLVKMGYGGSLKEAGKATRLTNDGGIDGIIKEDKLGLDVIYIQAKRWESQSVGRPDIQSFVGALDGQRANKGVFITTSKFADSAIEYVKTISKKVILIDGEQLANFMIDYGLGISTFTTYELKKIDHDYFED